jgi:hypothetical protein
MQVPEKYTVVKCTLNTFCRKRHDISSKLNDIALKVSKICFYTYKFASLHIIRLLENDQELPTLNQKFFYTCVLYTTKIKRNQPRAASQTQDLDETSEIFYKLYTPEIYRDNIISIISNMCKEMETATINHLTLNFWSRLYKYIKVVYNIKKPYKTCIGILSEEYLGNDWIVCKYREIMDYTSNSPKDVKNNPTPILRLYANILRYNTKCGYKLFNLLPSSSFKTNYFNIDYSNLYDILPITPSEFKKNQRKYWTEFFNIERFENNRQKFHSFSTDGVSVSVKCCREFTENEGGSFVFKKRKTTLKENQEKKPKKSKKKTEKVEKERPSNPKELPVWGFDPGVRYMYTGIGTESNDIEKLSSKEWYHVVGHNYHREEFQKIYKESGFEEKVSLLSSSKVYKTEEYLNYLEVLLTFSNDIMDFYFNSKMRKRKFTKYVNEQKMINKVCKKLSRKNNPTEDDQVIIGFGDWSLGSNSPIKGHQRGPVTRVIRELGKWTKVYKVDEYKTSKLCCNCYHETENMEYPNQRKRRKKRKKDEDTEEMFYSCVRKVNSVLRCQNNECGHIIDRDINGCKNILYVFLEDLASRERPEPFVRSEKEEEISNE